MAAADALGRLLLAVSISANSGRRPSVRKSLGWMAGGQGAYFLLQLVSSVVLARLLTPYEVGIFAVAFAVVGFVTIIQQVGLNNFLIREPDLTPDVSATVFTINGALALLLTVVIIGLGFAGASMFGDPGVQRVLLWLSVIPLIGAIGFLPLTLVERDGDFRLVSVLKTASSLAGTVATILFAVAGYSYMSFAYGQIITALVSSFGAIALATHHVSFRIGLARWREIQRFGLHMLGISGVTRAGTRLQDMLLAHLLGLSALGLYSRAGNIFSLLWDNIFSIISRVVFVDFAEAARAQTPLAPRYRHALALITAIMWPAFAGLAVLSGPFIYWIYGAKWLEVTVPLALLCIVGIFYTAVAMTWELFVLAGETGRQASFEFVRTIVGLALFIGGCFISLEAAAISRCIEAIFAVILYTPHVLRITSNRQADLWGIYLRSTLLAVAGAGPAALTMNQYDWSPNASLIALAAAVLAGVLAWLATLWLLRHPLFDEVMLALNRRRDCGATSGHAKADITTNADV